MATDKGKFVDEIAGAGQVAAAESRSPWRRVVARFFRDPLAVAGLVIMGLIILLTLAAPRIYSWEAIINVSYETKLLAPNAAFPFGDGQPGARSAGPG